VQVHRQHPVSARRADQVGNKLCRDGRAAVSFAVLTRIAKIGNDSGDAAGGGALQGIHADQELHQIVIGWVGGRLDHEDVFAADVLVDANEDFLVSEGFHFGPRQAHVQIVCDGLGQWAVCIARQ
tara:strand:- start:1114 stop:1488 length:375 start_codon:yes stop_codon:yes gene_type:complete